MSLFYVSNLTLNEKILINNIFSIKNKILYKNNWLLLPSVEYIFSLTNSYNSTYLKLIPVCIFYKKNIIFVNSKFFKNLLTIFLKEDKIKLNCDYFNPILKLSILCSSLNRLQSILTYSKQNVNLNKI